jgi:class 3 adenylate cyclase
MLSGSPLKMMLGLVRHAALPIEARATGEAVRGRTVSRRLVAIMAANVTAYLRLMEAAEEGTLARFKRQYYALIDPKRAHRSRTLKTTRDGMRVEFAKAVEPERMGVG